MYQRLPTLLNTAAKSGLRRGRLQQRQPQGVRSYATHQEQDQKPSRNSTPLIVSGLLILGGVAYFATSQSKYTHEYPNELLTHVF